MAGLEATVVSLIVFVPVVNLGFEAILGSGMWSENLNSPFWSVTRSVPVIFASAVPVKLTRDIPFLTYPRWSGLTWLASPGRSRFNSVEVPEYEEDLFANFFAGLLNGPSSWSWVARRNLILADPDLYPPTLSTISPVLNEPLTISTFNSFGVAYSFMSTFSMKT